MATAKASPAGFRSGFVSLVGRPNVGKSTILNALIGQKVSIVSPKPQTTRHRILGILHRPDAQVVFVDSPGWHKPQHALGHYLLNSAKEAMEEADLVLVVVDARTSLTEEDEWVFERVRQAKRPALLVVNKVDAVDKRRILPLLERCAATKLFEDYLPVSATVGDNMPTLLTEIIRRLPEGPKWYEESQVTDQPRDRRIQELIREQVFNAVRQEVPHAVAVQLEALEEKERVTVIQAAIFVERQGQKAILIGKRGSMLKKIGQAARIELERLVGRKVFLELWVKVSPDWRDNLSILRDLGYQEFRG